MKYILLSTLVLLTACSTEPIILKNSAGKTVQCGPYQNASAVSAMTAVQRESQCIQDFQRQGYERVPQ